MKIIAEKTGRSFRQARRLVRSLELKLAVEVTEPEIKEESEARGYRVWGMGPINDRRRAGGWNFIYRKANALTLARPLSSTPPPANLTGATTGQHDRRAQVSLAADPPVKLAANPPDKLTGKDLISSTNNKTEATTSTLRQLARIIQEALRTPIDDALLRSMVETCHQNSVATIGEPAPDEALLKFVSEKATEIAQQIAKPGDKTLFPKKVLVKAVAACFIGAPYEAYVEDVITHQEAAAADEAGQAAREAEQAENEARYARWSEISERHKTDQGYDLKSIAQDPDLDQKGREVAQAQLKRVGRFSQVGL